MEQSLLRHEYRHWRSRCEIGIVENNNAGGTMKNHCQDRQSEILPDHAALATANVSSVLPPSKTTMLRSSIGYRKCDVSSGRS
jgi:hypothetical protein